MDFDFGQEQNEDDPWKEGDSDSDKIDSETETTLLGLVHYNATKIAQPELGIQNKDQSTSLRNLEPGELDEFEATSLSTLECPAEPTAQDSKLAEVILSVEPVKSGALDPEE
ncbi:hypothetical protein L0F63_002917, partial [Massospora cicadina]